MNGKTVYGLEFLFYSKQILYQIFIKVGDDPRQKNAYSSHVIPEWNLASAVNLSNNWIISYRTDFYVLTCT